METNTPEPAARDLPWEQAFGAEVRRLRLARGWSQSEVARRMESRGAPIHQQQLTRIETGKRAVRLNEAMVLAQVFDRPLTDMLHRADDHEVAYQRALESLAELLERGERITRDHAADFRFFRQAQENASQAIEQFLCHQDRTQSDDSAARTLTERLAAEVRKALKQQRAWAHAFNDWTPPPVDPVSVGKPPGRQEQP